MGFVGSLVFYNAFLPEIAAPEDRDRVSAKGFSYGYIGSVLMQMIGFVLVVVNKDDPFAAMLETKFLYFPQVTGVGCLRFRHFLHQLLKIVERSFRFTVGEHDIADVL